MSLSNTFHPLLIAGSNQEDPARHDCKIVDWDVKNQTKQNQINIFLRSI